MIEDMSSLMGPTLPSRTLDPAYGADGKVSKEDARLRDACNQFEAIMTSIILKNGLQSAQEMGKVEGEESDHGTDTYKEMANEQLANFMGRQGMLGLGKMLYDNVRQARCAMTQGKENGSSNGKTQ